MILDSGATKITYIKWREIQNRLSELLLSESTSLGNLEEMEKERTERPKRMVSPILESLE